MRPAAACDLNTDALAVLRPGYVSKPGRDEAEEAVRTLLRFIGENPARDGLAETPARYVRALEQHFAGYAVDPHLLLQKTFGETAGYNEMVLLRAIPFESHCEHHVAPILGRAWVAYLPDTRVVGISKLARVVQAYAKRLQIQEKMTAEIADAIDRALHPKGVAVVLKATHHCMTTRGVMKPGTDLVTSRMLGRFRDDAQLRQEMLRHVD